MSKDPEIDIKAMIDKLVQEIGADKAIKCIIAREAKSKAALAHVLNNEYVSDAEMERAGINIRRMVIIAAMMTTFPFLAFADRGPAPDMVTCAVPFGRESTRSDLVRAFGAANVVDKEIEIQEGSVRPGTVVYPENPRSRLEIFLIGKPTRNPLIIRISVESQWTGWRGVHIGMTLEEIEGLNGRPFKLKRYDTAARGVVASTAW